MGKKGKRFGLEIRFSLGAAVGLLFCWLGISLLAFYLGMLMGRSDGTQVALPEFPVIEGTGLEQSPAELTFHHLLSLPESMTEFPYNLKQGKSTGVTRPEEPKERPPAPEKRVTLKGMILEEGKVPVSSESKGSGGTKLLQVASFKEMKSAGSLIRSLRQKGYPCFPGVASHGDSGTEYYRVFVGPYANLAQAAQAKRKLEEDSGLRGILIRSREEAR